MNMFVFFMIFSVWAILATVYCFFLNKRIKLLQNKVESLSDENTEKSNQISKFNQKNTDPLGPWLSPSSKSYTIHLDSHGKITYIDDNLLNLLGYNKKELLGRNIYGTLMSSISNKEPLETNIIKRIFKNPRLYTEHETELKTKANDKVWITWTNKMVYDTHKKPTELYSVGFDVTKRKILESELQFLASKDPQTNSLNKLSLLEIGHRELKRSIRYKHEFSVLALKIFFKNDENVSLKKSEQLLQQVITLCRHTIRDVDYIGRIGETEFCILLPETPVNQVKYLQKRIQNVIEDFNRKKSNPAYIKFGYSGYIAQDTSLDDIIVRALQNTDKKVKK